ncbi:MAG TPA: DUF2975 domain-containing protein [Rhizomicrobium sp.]|jgi:hypothetical protein|nr:DUF2975 domain-containing protein [Rhizomicrobium sp.]
MATRNIAGSWLFTFTHWLLLIAIWFSLIALAALAWILGWLVLSRFGLAHMPFTGLEAAGFPLDQIYESGIVTVLIAGVCFLSIFHILRLTARIIAAASNGDPFAHGNARRLTAIALLMLAVQLAGRGFDIAMTHYPAAITQSYSVYFDISASGMLAVLVIFVLAQIFRRGSEMRAELEGTV